MNLDEKIKNLQGPILVIGASGFVGANILRRCLGSREDVVGTFFSGDSWRLHDIPAVNLAYFNLQDPLSIRALFQRVNPKTIFDCSAFGAYSFENEFERIHVTNYLSFIRAMEEISQRDLAAYIHAGSSSEYGMNAAGPAESDPLIPNSHYAVSKAATSQAITYYGKVRGIPIVNLRLYSVYGPYEDSSRLIPVLCEQTLQGRLPVFARSEISRDFIYIDDVIDAFVTTAYVMKTEIMGESFNIGTGIQTSLNDLAKLSKGVFLIKEEPQFNPAMGRAWDVYYWVANPEKAKTLLGWTAKTSLETGLVKSQNWWKATLANSAFAKLNSKNTNSTKRKILFQLL